jgi:hypothetical protein
MLVDDAFHVIFLQSPPGGLNTISSSISVFVIDPVMNLPTFDETMFDHLHIGELILGRWYLQIRSQHQ